jgi:opacity protein-like surface antigen
MKKIALLLFACASPSLFAQSFEAGITLGESVINSAVLSPDILTPGAAASSNITLTDGFRFGFRVGLNPYRYMGAEFGYAYNRTQLHLDGPPASDEGMAIHQGFVDGLIHATKEGSRIRPFAAAGINFSNFVPPGSSASYGGGQTKFGFNYGAGVKVKVATNWMIRFDFRQYETGKPDFNIFSPSGRLFQNEISAGVAFAL